MEAMSGAPSQLFALRSARSYASFLLMNPAHFSFLNSAQVSIAEVAVLREPSVGARFIRSLMRTNGTHRPRCTSVSVFVTSKKKPCD